MAGVYRGNLAANDAVQTDSSANRPRNLRVVLKQIHDDLGADDLAALKFLCMGVIPSGKLEGVKTALELFTALEDIGRIREPSEVNYLADLLHEVGRKDLVTKLGCRIAEVADRMKRGESLLDPYRLLLCKLCDDLTRKDLDSLKYLCEEDLRRAVVDKIKSTEDLVMALEKQQLITRSNLGYLVTQLVTIQRHDLVNKINVFRNETPPGESLSAVPCHTSEALTRIQSQMSQIDLNKDQGLSEAQQKQQQRHQQQAEQRRKDTGARYDPECVMHGPSSLPNEAVSYRPAQVIDQYQSFSDNGVPQQHSPATAAVARQGQPATVPLARQGEPATAAWARRGEVATASNTSAGVIIYDNSEVKPRHTEENLVEMSQIVYALTTEHLQGRPESHGDHALTFGNNMRRAERSFVTQESGTVSAVDGNFSSRDDSTEVSPRDGWVSGEVEVTRVFVPPCYEMTHNPRGLCLIINNINFHRDVQPPAKKFSNRLGSDVDGEGLRRLFTSLQFKVWEVKDLKIADLTKLLKNVSSDDHSDYDCFVCCILTHGTQGSVYGVDGLMTPIGDLLDMFKASSCRSLRDKPKVFFIQACQGKRKEVVFTDGPDDEEILEDSGPDPKPTMPAEPHFLIGFSTTPGYVSFRSKTQGSFYISHLVEVIERYASQLDLLTMLTMVNDQVSEKKANLNGVYYQTPLPMHTLKRQLFFRNTTITQLQQQRQELQQQREVFEEQIIAGVRSGMCVLEAAVLAAPLLNLDSKNLAGSTPEF